MPAAQIEFVASAPAHRNRDLVRRCIEESHRRCEDAGRLVTYLTGIPYFYRQLGYEYAIDAPPVHVVDADQRVEMPSGWTVRPARLGDHAAVVALHRSAQDDGGADVRMVHDEARWRWFQRVDDAGLLIADGPDGGRATGRAAFPDGPSDSTVLIELAATDPAGVDALVAHVQATAPGAPVRMWDRPRTAVTPALTRWSEPRFEKGKWALYVRVADPARLLDELRPLLTARVERSPLAGTTADLTITLYQSSVVFALKDGEVVSATSGAGIQDPGAPMTIGVPPDHVATLLFGAHAASELERRHIDVVLGDQRALADALFPGVRADLLAY